MMPKAPSKNVKIDIMIIGAQKAGTTSIKNYMGEHPELQTHLQKEFGYFWDDSEFAKGFDAAWKKYFYKSSPTKKNVAKSSLLYTSKKGLLRLKEHNPDCKIVLLLRNPVERTYSAYQMEHNYGSLKNNFGEMKEVIANGNNKNHDWKFDILVGMSLYHQHLAMLWEIFPKEQVLVQLYEDLKDDPATLCRKLFIDCKVDPSFVPDLSKKYNITQEVQSHLYSRLIRRLLKNRNPIKKVARLVLPNNADYRVGEALRNINKTKKTPAGMSMEMRSFLTDYFKPFNVELEKMIGRDLSNWNK